MNHHKLSIDLRERIATFTTTYLFVVACLSQMLDIIAGKLAKQVGHVTVLLTK